MIHFEGTTLHRCLIEHPEKHQHKVGQPLVIGLHGGGSTPDGMFKIWENIPNRHFIFGVPQAPYPFVQNNQLLFDWGMWPSQDEILIQKATAVTEEYIQTVKKELTGIYNTGKTYLLGFSQGAIFTYIAGIKYHHLFDGIICLSGPGLGFPLNNPFMRSLGGDWLPEKFIQSAKNLRVLITHGNSDEAAKFELGIHSRDTLIKHGYDVKFFEFDGGHNYPPPIILEEIVDWINFEED